MLLLLGGYVFKFGLPPTFLRDVDPGRVLILMKLFIKDGPIYLVLSELKVKAEG